MKKISFSNPFRSNRAHGHQEARGESSRSASRSHSGSTENFYIGPPTAQRTPPRPGESGSPSAMRPRASLHGVGSPTRLPHAANPSGPEARGESSRAASRSHSGSTENFYIGPPTGQRTPRPLHAAGPSGPLIHSSGRPAPQAEVLGSLTTMPLLRLDRISGMTHRDGSKIHENVVGAFAREALPRPVIPGVPMPWDHTIMDVDVMATSADGAVRRYPRTPDGRFDLMPAGTICDIPAAHVKQRIGGIELTPDKTGAAFMVEGHPVSPLKLGQFQGHPLPGGKLLVLQPDQYQGGMACALMLLLDQGHLHPGEAHQFEPETGHRGASLQSVTGKLKTMTGQEPVVVTHEANFHQFGRRHAARNAFWEKMAARINTGTMGSAILQKGDRYLMLDNVSKEGGSYRITIRDPFHGTCVEFKDTHDFFKDLDHSEGKASLTAILLPRP